MSFNETRALRLPAAASGLAMALLLLAPAAAQQTADLANERISSLDDYDVREAVVVNFRLNSAVLSPEAKRQLDGLAEKALASKGFVIEVAGHADATGSAARNFQPASRRGGRAVLGRDAQDSNAPLHHADGLRQDGGRRRQRDRVGPRAEPPSRSQDAHQPGHDEARADELRKHAFQQPLI
jgi:hypothetical protein